MSDTHFLTTGELADRLGLPAAWLKREADEGRLPCIRAGRRRLFELPSVIDALKRRGEAKGARHAAR